MKNKSLLMSASVGVLILAAASSLTAQNLNMDSGGLIQTDEVRLKSETAELYASTIANLTQVIERAIANDAGSGVIASLRAGELTNLPALSPDMIQMIAQLRISAAVVDANDGTGTERVLIFIPDENLRNGVSRADVEREALGNGFNALVRFQNGSAVGKAGSFDISGAPGVPAAAFGSFLGINGNDLVTSGADLSAQVRVEQCGAGFYGTGVTSERDLDRLTTLDGAAVETAAGWVEVARDCSPETVEPVRYFDDCTGPAGITGRALYEAPQYVRKDPGDPFATEIFLDRAARVLTQDAQCLAGDRTSGSADFMINGRTNGPRELELSVITNPADIGNGPGTVPVEVNAVAGSTTPVASVPFPATVLEDFTFTRSCAAEYGNVAYPVPTGTPFRYVGPSQFSGIASFFRDYNRKETYFSDNQVEYILNYDLITDPNIFGHASKGRGYMNPPASGGGAIPGGDGWYKYTETCQRDMTLEMYATQQISCVPRYNSFPNGLINEQRSGTQYFNQTTADNPAPNGPTSLGTAWQPWDEVSNGCYSRVVLTSPPQSRTISSGRCEQNQTRTPVQYTDTFQDGRPVLVTNTFIPDWTNVGARHSCESRERNNESFDVNGDGRGDFDNARDAARNGFRSGSNVNGGIGGSCTRSRGGC